jgi:hypothetical protein
MRTMIGCFFIIYCSIGYGPSSKFPKWFMDAYEGKGLNKKYILTAYLKPAYLQADFNGDTAVDVAALIEEKGSNRKGILLIHNKTFKHHVFGAGIDCGNGSDDYEWLLRWSIYKSNKTYVTTVDKYTGKTIGDIEVKLKHPVLFLEGYESNKVPFNGIIYWNGITYVWIDQNE